MNLAATQDLASINQQSVTQLVTYEQPLNERMRTFLRLEFLFRQANHFATGHSTWDSRAAIASLLDILAILGRGDIRKDVLKELERHIVILSDYHSNPSVDSKRLAQQISDITIVRDNLAADSRQLTHILNECEFLASIKQRSAIPGGTCEFDLPDFKNWLGLSYAERIQDLLKWSSNLTPLRDALNKLLWLTREAASPRWVVAERGMYQQVPERGAAYQIVRVGLPQNTHYFPEISGSQHRFTIRFLQRALEPTDRAKHVSEAIDFCLTCC